MQNRKPFELLTDKEKIERLKEIQSGYPDGHNQIDKIE